jgi:hypothetical protein
LLFAVIAWRRPSSASARAGPRNAALDGANAIAERVVHQCQTAQRPTQGALVAAGPGQAECLGAVEERLGRKLGIGVHHDERATNVGLANQVTDLFETIDSGQASRQCPVDVVESRSVLRYQGECFGFKRNITNGEGTGDCLFRKRHTIAVVSELARRFRRSK